VVRPEIDAELESEMRHLLRGSWCRRALLGIWGLRRALVMLGGGAILTLLTLVGKARSTPDSLDTLAVTNGQTACVSPTGDFLAFLPLIACPSAPPQIHSINPSSASTTQGSVSVTIVGENFRGVPCVLLTRSGFADILGTGVNVTAGSRINCSFDISTAAPGVWDVLVVNPDGTDGRRSNAFTITAPPTPTSTPTDAPQVSSILLSSQPSNPNTGVTVTVYAVVRDQSGSAMAAKTVQFSVVDGSGSVSPSSADTNSQGQAQTDLTASAAGIVRVRGTVEGVSDSIEVQFSE
jgi:hypothetical protein